MEIRRFTFKDEGFSIDCWPPFPDLNCLYAAAAIAFLRPHKLAIDMGRMPEERNVELLASTYAEGVIAGSPSTKDGMNKFDPAQWRQWLLANRETFRILRSYCDVRRTFDPVGGEDGQEGLRPARQDAGQDGQAAADQH